MKKTFEFKDEKSNKFWTVETNGNDLTVTFGKIGTSGQTQTKAFADDAACEKEAEKLIREKTKKGYVEVALSEDAAATTTVAKVPDAPQPKAEPLSGPEPKTEPKVKAAPGTGPKAVKDDGKPKPWNSDDGYFLGEEAFANLEAPLDGDGGDGGDAENTGNKSAAKKRGKKATGNGATGVSDADAGIDEDDDEDDRAEKRARWHNAHTPTEQLLAELREQVRSSSGSYYADDDDDDDDSPEQFREKANQEDERLRKWIGAHISSAAHYNYRYRDAQPYIAALRLLISDDAEFQAQMVKNLQPGIDDILYGYGRFDSDDLERLVWLAERGAKLTCGEEPEEEKPIAKYIAEEYAKNPDPARIVPIYREFVAQRMADYAPKLVQAFAEAIRKFLRGEGEMQTLPTGAIGFQLRTETAYLLVSGEKSTHFAKLGLDLDKTGVTDAEDAARGMETLLSALLTQLADRGGFDGLLAKGLLALQITDYNGKLLFQRTLLDEATLAAQCEALLTLIAHLEKTEDFEAAAPGLKDGASALLTGAWLPVDVERARKLLRRFLYSGNEAAQEAAHDMLCFYDGRYPELQHDRALWWYGNGNYGIGKRVMGWASNKGYAPAAEALARFAQEDATRAARNAAFAQEKTEAKKGKIGKDTFHEVFSENDLLLKTENVLARADADGRILIRFKIEGEAAYGETLDWLCRLLEKDYASLNSGYEIHVRFLIKPEFIKALNAARNREEDWGFAKTSCHAFFARAVQYPALREKVKRYAELALNEFDWYRDIDGEENCVTGTFAACALAFAEEQYVPLIGLFARNSDDEHQYCQVFLPGPLFKQYGATPEVAAACYDLSASNGQGHYISLNAALLTTPACLRAVLEHLENPGHRNEDSWLKHSIPRYVEAIWSDNVKSNLKKFKAFAEGAKTSEDRNAFVDFHNFYKKHAAELNEEDYGPDLEAVSEKKDVVVPVWRENPPVLTPVAEAEKAGLTWKSDDKYDDRRGVFFFPVCIDDPKLLDHVYRQWDTAPKNIEETFAWGLDNAYRFGPWVWNPAGLAQSWGVILTDGKSKPCLLYGVLNVTQLAKQWAKRSFKSPEEAEAARQAAWVRDMPPPPKLSDAEKALDEKMNDAFSAVFGEHWWLAGQLLQHFAPEHGRYYDAALLLRARRAECIEEYAQAAAAYDEFALRRPEFAADIAAKKAEIGKGKKK